jgi:hypothetical protein
MALMAGASGFLFKDAQPDQIRGAPKRERRTYREPPRPEECLKAAHIAGGHPVPLKHGYRPRGLTAILSNQLTEARDGRT